MVVEDALTTREMLGRLLLTRGYRVAVVGAEDAPRRVAEQQPDAVVVNTVGQSGLELVPACRRADASVPLVVVSDADPEDGSWRDADTRVIIRPFADRQLEEALTAVLGPLIRPDILPAPRTDAPHPASALLGESPLMAEVRRLVRRAADSNATVLVCGESGTGKEVTARALRQGSHLADRPFVKVNCAALPTDLLESELFGHERGAFTGAMQAKPGKFELADRGTMFLDEIGEMSPALQAKLLQVLQDGVFSRLGSTADTRVHVRIIAATNRDLRRSVADGQFREDLYFRLNVVRINLPPLRDHKDDLPLLTEHFFERHAAHHPRGHLIPRRLSPETRRLFLDYDWPGNVRELENMIQRILVLGSESSVQKDLCESLHAPAASVPAGATVLAHPTRPAASSDADARSTSLKDISRTAAREAERVAILATLERTRWNRKEAAESLGISYKALLYKIRDNHLDDEH
ncbi:MAG: sigma-54 dependent transcriptional regulator [Vicinamibacterales bacterium]